MKQLFHIRVRSSVRACVVAGLCAAVVFVAGMSARQAWDGDPLAPLANPVVNAADTTEHDTQSTTAIVLGSGSNVITTFTNSAVNDGSNKHMTGWSRSANGGTAWADGGALPASTNGDGGSPMLARDNTTARLYLSTKAFSGSGVQMFRSNDNAATWAAPVEAMPGFGGGDVLDHPWTAVDNFPGTGQGNVYVVARNTPGGGGGSLASGVYFSKSIDGGTVFTKLPAPLSSSGTGPNVVVGPDHAVYVFWWINLAPAVIRFVKSTNFGTSFGLITTAATLTGNGVNGDLGLGGGFRTNSFPSVAVNPLNGDLYVVYNDKNGSDKGDIFIVGSADGGTTWDPPALINNDGPYVANRDQFMPSATFTPDGRRLLVTWYDRRSDGSNSLIEKWGVIATLSAITHLDRNPGPNFRISTGSWPVVIGQDTFVAADYMGDYDTATADNSFFYVTWGDNRLSNTGTAPLPHANQPDVRFAKIPVSGAPPSFDVDRDLQSDRTIFRPSTGFWYSALSNGGGTATAWGTTNDVDVMADYDGDGKADIAVFRPSTGIWYIVQSSNGAVRTVPWGTNGDIPFAGDVTGDGKADLFVWRPSNGTWYINISSGGTFSAVWGASGDIPLFGDFNYELNPDLTVFRPSTGTWYTLTVTSQGAIPTAFAWGTSGDIPVRGDFDGDRLTDYTVFRPTTGQWFVNKSTGGTIVVTWGTSGDIPVSGDWDGDGKSDFTVWRPSTGAWYTQFATGGSAVAAWGTTGDVPTGRTPGT
jgi:hypothetical protein